METYRKAMQSDEWRTPKGSRHQRKYQLRQQKPNKSKQTDIQNTGVEKNHEVKTLQKKKKTKTEKSRAAARAAKQEWRSQRAWDDHIALLKEETELRMDKNDANYVNKPNKPGTITLSGWMTTWPKTRCSKTKRSCLRQVPLHASESIQRLFRKICRT